MVWGPDRKSVEQGERVVLSAPVRVLVVDARRGQLAKALLARSWVKLTVPLGAVAESGVMSVTVAVQLLGLDTGPLAWVQLTAVLVSCLRAVTMVAPLEPS